MICQRIVSNSDERTWDMGLRVLECLDVTPAMVNERLALLSTDSGVNDSGFITFAKQVQQSTVIRGGTLLHNAVKYSSFDIVKFLIDKEGNLNLYCDHNHSIYYYAKYERNRDLKDSSEIVNHISNLIQTQPNIVNKPYDFSWNADVCCLNLFRARIECKDI